jgi:PBSX family phage portal protein
VSETNETSEASSEVVIKVSVLDIDGDGGSNVLSTDAATNSFWSNAGALPPPEDPVRLLSLTEFNATLRASIDAYAGNIDSHGWTLVPAIDLTRPDIEDQLKAALLEEQLLEHMGLELIRVGVEDGDTAEGEGSPVSQPLVDEGLGSLSSDVPLELEEVTSADVQTRLDAIRVEMIRERVRVERFFRYCCSDQSFTALREQTRKDAEATGNAYWEVVRDARGEVSKLNLVPSFMMRLLPLTSASQQVDTPVQYTLVTRGHETVTRKFRKYVQITSGSVDGEAVGVYFKEFGDPRTVSARTGKSYRTPEGLAKSEPEATAATEVLHFKVWSPRSSYGVPRWISESPNIIGSRNADEVNMAWFNNKAIPPMILTVSGGRLKQDETTKLRTFFANELKGVLNYHKIAILEAETGQVAGMGGAPVKIDVIRLRELQQEDATHLAYKEATADGIGVCFRLPRLLRGDARDFNRATAVASLQFAEDQVFRPLRRDFDDRINRTLLEALGVNFWRFVSKGPVLSDPTELLKAVNEAEQYLTPNEQRQLAERGFAETLPPVHEPWASVRPLPLTIEAMKRDLVQVDGAEIASGSGVDDDEVP